MLSAGVQGHGYSYQSEDRVAAHLNGLLDKWAERLRGIMDEPTMQFPGWDDWDALGRAVTESTHQRADALQANS